MYINDRKEIFMREQKIKNHTKEKALTAILAGTLILSASNLQLFAADQNDQSEQTLTQTSAKDLSKLSDKELAALANPVVQTYTADASHSIWKASSSTRFAILANQENMDNERLAEVVKLVNAEFADKGTVSDSPFAMVYAVEEETGMNDVIITIEEEPIEGIDNPEAYRIEVNANGVHVFGASENAVMYALRTIQNYMIVGEGMVYGTIEDYPEMAERRIHVDCARKYISKDWFIRQIRELSYLKMNALQIHFSENMGFRIECETDPAIMSDQYLTKVEVREILEEARKYGIKVIPSFDSPGHVDQILKAHPEYGQISNKGTHYASGLDITNPEAVAYIRSLYSEYMDLFEGCTDFHIGGDEYMEFDRNPFRSDYKSVLDAYAQQNIDPKATWKDTVANYINELAAFVHERGFKPRVWNDGLYYGENSSSEKPQMIVMHDYIAVDFWSQMTWNRDIANLDTIVKKGFKDIYNINASFFYYVLRNDKPTDGREQHSFDYIDQERRIFEEWTPGKFQSNTVADDSDFIKGASLAIWCDNAKVADEDTITSDIADELRSLATKSWNTKSNTMITLKNFQDNYAKLGNAAGFEKGSQLPEVGDILPADSLGNVIIHYVSDTGATLKKDRVHYGTIGDDYTFNAEDIYGYRLKSEAMVNGKYAEEQAEYTFVYERYCDKTALETELNNPLLPMNYITETIQDYQSLQTQAQAVFENDESEQWDVDQILTSLTEAKQKAVKLEYYPLYIEVTYPLTNIGYVSGYNNYLAMIDRSKKTLYQTGVTSEDVLAAFVAVKEAKDQLMKPDGIDIDVKATDNYYVDYSKGESYYNYDKMLDGNTATKCWFGQEQVAGKEIIFMFPRAVNMSSIRIVQPADVKDDALAGADVEVAQVEGEWQKVGSFTPSQLDYTVDFDTTSVRYVRIKLTQSKLRYWYQIQDVFFTYEQPKEDNTLRDMILEAEELSLQDKTPSSIRAFVDVLIEAQKIYAQQSGDTSEIEEQLRTAIDTIMNDQEIDKTELQSVYDRYYNIENTYTEETWNVFKKALDSAKAILDNEDAKQEEINQAKDALIQAYENLRHDTSFTKRILNQIIEKTEGFVSDGKLNTLAPNVAAMIRVRLAEAKAVYDDQKATDDTCLNAWLNLANALQYLDFVADKADLEKLIILCEGINTSEYISGVEAFEAALNNAQEVFADENVLQETINHAYTTLMKAKDGLVKDQVDKEVLQSIVNKIVATIGDGSAYKKDAAWDILQQALTLANEVLHNAHATTAQIHTAITNLTNAYMNIRLNPDEALLAKLEEFTNAIDQADLSLYREHDVTRILNAKRAVATLLADPDNMTALAYEELLPEMEAVRYILENGKVEVSTDPKQPEDTNGSANVETSEATNTPVEEMKGTFNPGTTKTGDTTNVFGLSTLMIIGAGVLHHLKRNKNKK